ncbi:glycosyltransferase family 2 protein [Aeromonas caviae]|uniref:glycosyltransferase family 2 protein n=1 Tax=Aeromonas caviae TaxID=648 RepID=UPI0038D0FCA5
MLISIIITAYNRDHCISNAINSALSQEYLEPYEIIVIDDGSTDETRSILSEFIRNSQIQYYFKENGGAASAKNFGACVANGDFIIFLDSDDIFYDKHVLDKLVFEIKTSSIDFVSFDKVSIRKNNECRLEHTYGIDEFAQSPLTYMLHSPLNYPGKPPYLFRKETFIKVGMFDESAKWGDAIAFWRHFFVLAKDVSVIKSIGYVYDQSSDSSVSRGNKNKYRIALSVLYSTYLENEKNIKSFAFEPVWFLCMLHYSLKSHDVKRSFLLLLSLLKFGVRKTLSSIVYLLKSKGLL